VHLEGQERATRLLLAHQFPHPLHGLGDVSEPQHEVGAVVATQRIAIERRDPGQPVAKITRRQSAGDRLLIYCDGLTLSA
jgi:hypothetical protein